MSDKNRRRLAQLDAPGVEHKMVSHALLEMGRLASKTNPTRKDAVRYAKLLAIEIFLMAPMRGDNVANLDLDQHFIWPPNGAGVRSERARRPAYLLSNLIKCGTCGGGFSKVSNHHYGCSNARNRGICDSRLIIRRDVLEASVLSGLKTHLMQPELVKEFAAEYHRELNRLNAARDGAYTQQKEELARVERQVRAIIEAIKEGLRTPGMKEELLALEGRKAELVVEIKAAPAPVQRLHPRLADLRDKVDRLQESLNAEDTRGEAAEALRALIDEIRLVPESDHLEIELAGGDLATLPASWR